MATYKRIDRGKESIRGLSEKTGLSIATFVVTRHCLVMSGSPRKQPSGRRSSSTTTMRDIPGPRPPRTSASTSTPSDDAPAAPAETAQQHRPPQQPTPTRTRSPRPDTHRMSPRLPSRLLSATGRHFYAHFSQQHQQHTQ